MQFSIDVNEQLLIKSCDLGKIPTAEVGVCSVKFLRNSILGLGLLVLYVLCSPGGRD